MAIDINDWTYNDIVWLKGDVTQLQAIAMEPPTGVAKQLGLASDRMVRGYWICVLNYDCDRATFMRRFFRDFIYAGTTLRSGGRMGLPADTPAADRQREHAHDLLMEAYGKTGYDRVKHADLQRITPKGHSRLVKVVPFVRHDKHLAPSTQYPPGGAHLQWTLTNTKAFTCAAKVDGAGLATTKDFAVSIAPGAPRDNHFRLLRFLEQA